MTNMLVNLPVYVAVCECAFVKASAISGVYPQAVFLKIPSTGQLHLL